MNKKTKNLKIKFELNIVVAFYTRKKIYTYTYSEIY